MKKKMTKAQVEMAADKVYFVPYADLDMVLANVSANGYNSGVYGWNWDVYFFAEDNTMYAIVTGYRNFCGKRLEGYKALEQKAKEQNDLRIDYTQELLEILKNQ